MATAVTGPGTLTTSGYFTISSGTTITGMIYGAANVTPTITNFGTVALKTGSHGAFDLFGGGTVTNNGVIKGGTLADGVEMKGSTSSKTLVINNAGHYINGTTGISFLNGAVGTVVNAGTVVALSGSAIYSALGATITNTGTLSEVDPGDTLSNGVIDILGVASITNSGLIVSTNTRNFGGALGIEIASGTITNSGTILGAAFGGKTYAIDFTASSGGDLLNLAAGQKLGGIALAHGANNTVALAAGTGIGTISNPGNYIDFQKIIVQQGADWSLGAAGKVGTFSGVTNVSNFGTLNIAGSIATTNGGVVSSVSIDMEGSVGSASVVDFTGTNTSNALYDFGASDSIVFAALPNAAGASLSDSYNTATGVLTVTETNASGAIVGSETVTVAGTAALNSGSFLAVEGPGGATVAFGSAQLNNSGSIFIDYGQHVTLTNTTGVDTIPVTFGSHGTSLALNVLDINGTVVGTNSPYTGTISGFGLNDDIVIGTSVLPIVATGGQVSLSYAGSLLSVTELNAAGVSIGSTTINVGTGYAAGSFVALLGTNGINIETPATVDETPLTFNTSGTASFEDPTKYSDGLAPGGSIVAGETVIVASGTASIATASPVANSGTIIVSGASSGLIDSAPLTGLGTVIVSGGGTLTLANATGATTNTISFGAASAGNPNVLNLDGTGTASFAGVVAGMGANDTIDLGGSFLPTPGAASAIGLSFNSGTDLLTISDTVGGTVYTDTLHFSGTVPGTFAASVVGGNIVITDVPCFAAGTRILTPRGQVSVESLAEGDEVLTARDGLVRKIVWTGQRSIDLSRHANPEKVTPVIILAGAFGEGAPERNLTVSPDHALFIKGYLIEAKTLVNGTTIIRDKWSRFVTYHHIELDQHDVVLAEGLEAETYLDSGNRQNFDSDADATILHPDFAAVCREGACAELLVDGDIVCEVRQELLDRAQILGFQRMDAVDLTVKAGVERITASVRGSLSSVDGELTFVLPAGAKSISLISATGVPAELSADPSDRRVLGVAIESLALISGGRRVEIDLTDPTHQGFYAAEPGHRWTNGNAQIDLPAYQGRAVLEVVVRGQAARWAVSTEQQRYSI